MTENEFLRVLFDARDSLETHDQKIDFDKVYFDKMKNPVVQYGYNYYLGFLGVDKFTLGNSSAGFLKLFCSIFGFISFAVGVMLIDEGYDLGGLLLLGILPIFIWIIVDYFRTPAATRRYNGKKLTLTMEDIKSSPHGKCEI